MKFSKVSAVIIALVSIVSFTFAANFPLSIIHINDFHARFEPTNAFGGSCESYEKCIGGYARTVYTVKSLLKQQAHQNPVFINAGDSFQGTLWYNIGRWNVTSEFLNLLPADAMTLGNHEFDHGVEGVVPFLDALNTTMLVANMDSTREPALEGKYKKSMIIERGDRKIGLIGVILETTYNLANTGKLIFYNESVSILEEAAKLKCEGANIIIVISHCGYDVDQIIAQQAGGVVDVIVGAHSHTFLYTGDKLPGPDKPGGPYPTEIIHDSGNRVLIVQASAYAKYVGNITVFFDDEGRIVNYEGAPLFMGADVPQDEEVIKYMIPWKKEIDAIGEVVIGTTEVDLVKDTCSSGECNLGDFFCDSMIHAFADLTPYNQVAWPNVVIGLTNTGSLRVPLLKGNITYSQLVTMSPFENTLIAFNIRGSKLREAFEYSVLPIDLSRNKTDSLNFLQVAGLKVTFNFTRPANHRVRKVWVRCGNCKYPQYNRLRRNKIYRIVAPSFLVNGGDGFTMFRDYATDKQEEMTDLEALMKYTKFTSPINIQNDGRITVVK